MIFNYQQKQKKYQDLWETIWKKIITKLLKTTIYKSDIEQIILIGCSSRTLGIQEEVKKHGFNEKVIFIKKFRRIHLNGCNIIWKLNS